METKIVISKEILDAEYEALMNDHELYLECMNGKPLYERETEQERRDGLILFHHVYKFIRSGKA